MSKPAFFGELAKGHRSRPCAALLTPRPPGRTSCSQSFPMKFIPLVPLTVLVSVTQVFPMEEIATAAGPVASTYITDSLEVRKFTPPAPPVQKELLQIRIDFSVTVPSEKSRTLTIQRGEASTAADIPPPVKLAPSNPPRELTSDELAELKWHRQHSIHLGATIYDHKTSQVHWTDQETGKTYQAWCGFDVSLLAGLGGFVHKGESYQLLLMHSSVDSGRFHRIAGKNLDIPEISPGQILVTQGNTSDALGTLQVVQEVIAAEKERLLAYQSGRTQYQREAAEWERAYPTIPRNETFILRPHRGSRYLADPQPEKKGEAIR
jgi:hypothetical protein